MKRCAAVLMLICGWTGLAFAEQGEYWEVTSKMEMPGMPMAMPETTLKVCLPKDGANDPRKSMNDPNSTCEMTDLVSKGNTTTWKMRCNQDGSVMTGSGEVTSTADSYQGVMRLNGDAGGMPINMTQSYRGKKVGGSCTPPSSK